MQSNDVENSVDRSPVEAKAVRHLMEHCGGVRAGEHVIVIYNQATADVAQMAIAAAQSCGAQVREFEIPPARVHGQDPPADVAAAMLKANLVLGLTTMSMAHSQARMQSARAGARYLSLPEYSRSLLSDPSLMADFRGIAPIVRRVADAFTAGNFAHVRSPGGTDIHLDIRGRVGNFCPGFVTGPGDLGSPPDIEANVSPVEDGSEGVAVIDGSIPYPGLGLLRKPIKLTVAAGRIVKTDGDDIATLNALDALLASVGSEKAYVLAELGVGLNPLAKLTGIMLTDEGASGCIHFGFGSNSTVGGKNQVPFHLDFVFHAGAVSVDDRLLIDNGRLAQ